MSKWSSLFGIACQIWSTLTKAGHDQCEWESFCLCENMGWDSTSCLSNKQFFNWKARIQSLSKSHCLSHQVWAIWQKCLTLCFLNFQFQKSNSKWKSLWPVAFDFDFIVISKNHKERVRMGWRIPSLSKSHFLGHQVWVIWQQCLTFIWQWLQSNPS